MDPSSRSHSLHDLLAHADWVRQLAQRLVGDPAAADDLVQETWLRALRSRGGRPDRNAGSTKPWLATVLRNVWREGKRHDSARTRREEQAAAPETLSSGDEQLQSLELQQLLAEAVSKLDEPYRSVVMWRYYEGLSSAEIARRQGLPADRVRWRLMRAHELLREQLHRDHGDEWSIRFAFLVPASVPVVPGAPGAPGAPGTQGATGATASGTAVGSGAFVMSMKMAATIVVALAGIAGVAIWRAIPRNTAADTVPSVRTALPAPASNSTPVANSALETAPRLPRKAVEALGFVTASSDEAASRVGAVYGTVVAAEDGTALEDVTIYLHKDRNKAEGRVETRSDTSGRFRFDAVSPDTYEVSFLVAGRVPRTVTPVVIEADAEHALEVELSSGFAVAVDVRDGESGHAVAGAEVLMIVGDRMDAVWVTAAGTSFQSVSAVSDASGRAVVEALERGTYQVVVRADGYVTHRDEASMRTGKEPLLVELTRGGRLHGRVTRSDGAPAVGARVLVNSKRYIRRLDDYFYAHNAVEVDAHGDYAIENIPEGEHFVAVLNPDGSGAFHMRTSEEGERELEAVPITANADTRLDLRIPAPMTVAGHVSDQDGEPVVGAKVSVSWGDFKARHAGFFDVSRVPGLKDAIHHATETDAEGRFEISTLRATYRPLEFTVRAPGYVKGQFEVESAPGQRVELTVELTKLSGVLSGRLVDEAGEPVPDITVGAWESEEHERLFLAQSDANGQYEIAIPMMPPTFEVFPILRDHDVYVSAPENRRNIAANSEDIDFVLRLKHVLEGRVVDENGDSVRDFEVHLLEIATQRYDHQRDADQGDGRYRIPVNTQLHESALFTAPGFAPTRVMRLAPSREQDVTLLSAPTLGGWVVDSAGNGIENAIVSLATMDSKIVPYGSEASPRVRTGPDGRFQLEGVPEASGGTLLIAPGCANAPALVHVPLDGLAGSNVRIEIPRSVRVPIEIVTRNGAAVEGTIIVVDSSGWPLDPRIEAGLRLFDEVDDSSLGALVDGRTHFDLAPGDYWLVLLRANEPETPFELTVTLPDDPQSSAEPTRFVVDD